MFRSLFFNVGLLAVLIGAGLLYVDVIILNVQEEVVVRQQPQKAETSFRGMFTTVSPDGKKMIVPPIWAPYCLMSAGAVALLYATALPRRSGK
ncbi:hypothetical protein MNBD_PLANCTO02-2304 [hydrothermal vent metagenome]|uniref:Uncharacterized protein n=1 Tax=hydrothermal vent metagenome TaxID=652676 RepID=A0A3B1DSX3_9ZZZZ